jgi:8-oxo-dGTP diphosphatase
MYKYTLCFIKQGNKLLMLNRDFQPAKGLWNGVGGKIDEGESPYECVLREVFEETGIQLNHAEYKGIITWKVDATYSGGMYAFLAEVPEYQVYPPLKKIDEGILDWKDKSWVLDEGNLGVGEMIPKFLPSILNDEQSYEHQCTLFNNKLTEYIAIPISSDIEGAGK